MSNTEKLIKQFAPELHRNIIFILTAPREQFAITDVSSLSSNENPLATQNTMFLRDLQIIRDSYNIIMLSNNIETMKSRLVLLHQTIFSISPYWALLGEIDLTEVFGILDKFKSQSHTAFYVNSYLQSINKSKESKRKATIDKYYKLAIESLKSGTTDPLADQSTIESYLGPHRNDPAFDDVETQIGIDIVITK